MLILPEAVFRQLRQHGEAAYPLECCGILTGCSDGAIRTVTRAVPTDNSSTHPRNHYEIAPIDLIRTEREARAAGCEILGFYHSHPDHPAQWSPTDLAEAHWLGCSYLITAIEEGSATATNSFHLAGILEEDKRFEEEDIQVITTPELQAPFRGDGAGEDVQS
jgi:proteasome lid subunit RPN8/RPN11